MSEQRSECFRCEGIFTWMCLLVVVGACPAWRVGRMMREIRSFNWPSFIVVSKVSLLQILQKRYSNLESAWDSLARRETKKAGKKRERELTTLVTAMPFKEYPFPLLLQAYLARVLWLSSSPHFVFCAFLSDLSPRSSPDFVTFFDPSWIVHDAGLSIRRRVLGRLGKLTGVTNHRWSMWVIVEPLSILVEKIKWSSFSLTVTASDIGLREPVQKPRC